MLYLALGTWFAAHYRARANDSDVQTVARQMRKQGFPLEIALAVLAHR